VGGADYGIHDAQREGLVSGPKVFFGGKALSQTGGHGDPRAHLNIMASGGVVSPTDRIDPTQYSVGEIEAVVEEAAAANRYVTAHAYTGRASRAPSAPASGASSTPTSSTTRRWRSSGSTRRSSP
jgi:imidazolonepropionase-like amidohydrolase